MNNSQIKALAHRKGFEVTKIGGQLRVVIGHKAEYPTSDIIAHLERHPDFVAPAERARENAIDLSNMNRAQRDEIVLRMMQQPSIPAVEAAS